MKQRIALIGLGPHAMRIYYPYIEGLIERDDTFSFDLLIDLASNRSRIEAFLKTRRIQPRAILYLDETTQVVPSQIDPKALAALTDLRITRAIVATEPKAHKIYLEACVKLGIHVLTDKPITAPAGLINSFEAAEQIYTDAEELNRLVVTNQDARILVQCQRRNHAGYRFVFDTLQSLMNEYGIPITYISIMHSDGMWNMPDELFYRENHPYKYGYGKLMHSGYHFVDLLAGLFEMNETLISKRPDTMTVFSQYSRAYDQQAVIGQSDYARFFGEDVAAKFAPYAQSAQLPRFGEVDSYSQFQLSKDDRIITTAQLSLLQSGFSQRAWPDLPEDSYKSNGRIRHESVVIHVGPLASIQVHSYQSRQVGEQATDVYDIGGNNHFDIHVFRNSNLIGGKPFEKIEFGAQDPGSHEGGYLGHNEYARQRTLDELMYGLPSNSEIDSHMRTNRLLSELYKNHVRQNNGDVPFVRLQTKEMQ